MREPRPKLPIPFERHVITGDELRNIAQAIERRELKGNGPFTTKCQDWLQEKIGAASVLMTHSGTAALEMAALLAGIDVGDEVILPSFTFTSTANAFLLRGARLVFADISPDTLNIDPTAVERLITSKTKAICLVHYGSVACDMDRFARISKLYEITIIEDAAHAVLAEYHGKPLGSFGATAALSFHQTKNFSAGEGGALLINDPGLLERAEILWEKGTNRKKFLRGEVDKYTWVDMGSSFLASELTCAFLWGQLVHAEAILEGRTRAWNTYKELLQELETDGFCRLPVVPEECSHVAHIFYLLLPDQRRRDALMKHLNSAGIAAVFHYIPLHSAPMGIRLGNQAADLPITEDLAARLLRLPMYSELTFDDQLRIAESIYAFFKVDWTSIEYSQAI